MKRILFSLLAGSQAWFIGFLAGADYSEQGFALAYTYACSLGVAAIVYTSPFWKKP